MNDDANRMAMGMMALAQKRLIHDYPFHAHFLATWKVTPTDTVNTAGITVRDGAVHLFYSLAFVVECSLPELGSVLVHEINHVVFEHVFNDPADYPDRYALMVAEEVTVNEWVTGPLPAGAITLDRFPDLPANEDTLMRYKRLAKPKQPSSPEPGNCAPEEAAGVPKGGSSVPKTDTSVPKNGIAVPNSPVPGNLQPFDDHSLWAEARESERLGKMTVRVAVAAAGML